MIKKSILSLVLIISVWFAVLKVERLVSVDAPEGKTEEVIVTSVVSQLNSAMVCKVLSVAKFPKVVFIVSRLADKWSVLSCCKCKSADCWVIKKSILSLWFIISV